MSEGDQDARPGPVYKPYSKYKDSGVEWLGKIPSHWKVSRVLERAYVINGYPFDSECFTVNEGVPLVRIRDLYAEATEVNYVGPIPKEAWIDNGDVLIGMDGDFNAARWRGGRALLNQRMCCVRAKTDSSASFIAYMLPFPLQVINDLTYSTTVKHLSSKDVGKILFGCPPEPEEQHVITKFLDRKTIQVDALIAKKERLIALLQEKRTALITQAVTKGLDPTVPMKDSGVEWLGKIPAHWETKRIKWAAKMESGHTPDKKIEAYWINCDIPWVSLNDTGFLRDHDYISDTAYMVNALGLANSSARLLPEKAVVFSRDATVGLCAITTRSMAVSQHFIAWLCRPELKPEYLLYVFRSMTQELERLTMGATIMTIGMPDVKTLSTPIPPIPEQEHIVQHIRRQTAQLDGLITRVHDAIVRLKQYRTALISAAVTGKIDVRGEVA